MKFPKLSAGWLVILVGVLVAFFALPKIGEALGWSGVAVDEQGRPLVDENGAPIHYTPSGGVVQDNGGGTRPDSAGVRADAEDRPRTTGGDVAELLLDMIPGAGLVKDAIDAATKGKGS